MNHSEKAQAVARETGWDLDEFATERGWSGVGMGPVGQHRDSDPLDKSNYIVVLKNLKERFGESVDDTRFRHWAVGWVEEVVFDNGNAEVVAAVDEWRANLDDYPIADEEHHSQMEWDDNHPDGDRWCYSEDSTCGCDRPNVNDPPKSTDDDEEDGVDEVVTQ